MRRCYPDISPIWTAIHRYCTRQMSRVPLRLYLGQRLAFRGGSAPALSLGQGADADREGDEPEPYSEIPGPPRAVKVELPLTESGEVDWAAIKPCPMHFPPAKDEESPYRTTWDPS